MNNCDGEYFCLNFVKPIILKADECDGRCSRCRLIQAIWLMEEYEEPETDWNKVEVNTPILVRNFESEEWRGRYFARYENETIYVWCDGRTSWSAYDNSDVTNWTYTKLAEQEKSDE